MPLPICIISEDLSLANVAAPRANMPPAKHAYSMKQIFIMSQDRDVTTISTKCSIVLPTLLEYISPR
jgi:hypothetical protein